MAAFTLTLPAIMVVSGGGRPRWLFRRDFRIIAGPTRCRIILKPKQERMQ